MLKEMIPDLFETRAEARAFGEQCYVENRSENIAEKLDSLIRIANFHLNQISNNHLLMQEAFLAFKRIKDHDNK